MFYRFKSKFAVQERLETFIVGIPGSERRPIVPGPKRYDDCFTLVEKKDNLSIYKAPTYNAKVGLSLRCHPSKEKEIIPDLWGVENSIFCSEKFKALVEKHDDFEHEFIEIDVLDDNENKLDKGQKYYWFNVRRFIDLEEKKGDAFDFAFDASEQEAERLSTLISEQRLVTAIDKLPLWRWKAKDGSNPRKDYYYQVLFLNSDFVEQIRLAGLTGLELYSVPYGQGEESLVQVNWQWEK